MITKARVIDRTAPWRTARLWLALGVLAVGAALAARPAAAQLASAEQLHEIVGPVALYPDDLVAIILPASTYPLQVVQAARFLEDRKDDSGLQPNEDWDDSIVALLNYPEVLKLLNDDLDWTYDLGTAVLNQRADVLNAIQGFRDQAYAAGNLRSDERQTVARENGTIEIKPANPQVIYVPYYEPERVVVYQPAPVYYYYPRPYPVYYYPYPAHHRFGTSLFWGVNSWFSVGWHSHHVHVYDPFYYGHPYYGWTYYNPFYVRNVYVNVNHYQRYPNHVWEPKYRYGGRPVARGSEGRVYTTDRAPRRGVLDSNAAAARSREGSAYRTTDGRAASANAQSGTRQPQRGVPSASYRNRSVPAAQPQTEAAAQAGRSTSAAPAPRNAQAQERRPAAATERSAAPASPSADRRGGGMSQALERSTGMPRESTRAAPPESAPAARPPSGAGTSAQRSDSVGSYRGNSGGNSGNASYRGGGGSQRAAHPAARSSR